MWVSAEEERIICNQPATQDNTTIIIITHSYIALIEFYTLLGMLTFYSTLQTYSL